MSITLRQLKYFVAAAELGQISQAAIQLAISQSAVTSAIRELEETVGAALFERGAHGVTLTHSGRGFLNHAYNILSSVDEALRMPSAAEDVSGRLLLAASYTVIGYFLPYHLQRLSQQYPQLDIQLHELNRSAIEEGLIANRYDMAVLLTSNVANPTWRSSISSVRPGGYGCRPGILAGARYRHAGRRGARAFHHVDGGRSGLYSTALLERNAVRWTCGCAPRRSRPCAAWWPTAAAWRCCRTWFTGPGRWKGGASRRSSSRIRFRP